MSVEAIAAILTILLPIMAWLGRKLWAAWVRARIFCESLTRAVVRIDKVYAEFMPNGGGSVKDQLNRLEADMRVLRSGLSFSLALNPHCIFEADPSGDYTFVNVALCELLGSHSEEMLGRGWLSSVVDARTREEVWETWRSCVEKKLPYQDRFMVRNPRSGERFFVRAHAVPAGHPERPLHYFGTLEREV